MRSVCLPAFALLAACSPEPEPEAKPTPRATVAAPRTLVAADFDPAMLGARVAGMNVTDAAIGGRKAPIARVSAFVACEKEVTDCDPAILPEGTIFTYVLTITPALAPAPSPSPSATPADLVVPVEAPAALVGTDRVVPGFNGALGFSRVEAAAALGAEEALTVTLDQNRLIWRVTGGSGWRAGKPITLWWQSTRAPGKPAAAYRLEYGGERADISAPFPAADKPADR